MMKDKASIAVIGAGWWAAINHIPLLAEHKDVQLAGICGLDQEALGKLGEKFNILFVTQDYKELLAIPGLDGIVISSPHIFHYEHAKAALEAGLHVMVEKPLTTSSETARDLVKLAASKNRIIMLPYGWNFRRMTDQAREWVHSDMLGEVSHVVLQMASPTEDLFDGRGLAGTENDIVTPESSTWASSDHPSGYGWGQLAHALGIMFRVTDEVPSQVFALTQDSSVGCDYYDSISLKFKSGATAVISGSASSPAQVGFQLDLRVFGTKGVMLLDYERERVEIHSRDGRSETIGCKASEGDYVCIEPINAFVDVCRGLSVENKASGVIGCYAIEVLDAMYRSASSGKLELI